MNGMFGGVTIRQPFQNVYMCCDAGSSERTAHDISQQTFDGSKYRSLWQKRPVKETIYSAKETAHDISQQTFDGATMGWLRLVGSFKL